MPVKIKRIYDKYEKGDGYRILVDGLWPRGIKKEDAKLDEWNKELAPSTALRKWFDHKDERFAEFSKKFYKEIFPAKAEEISRLMELAKKKNVTILYGARNTSSNHAAVLRAMISNEW